MNRPARIVEILLGAFFLIAALLKALDMEAFFGQIALYRIIEKPEIIRLAGYLTVALEAIVGGSFVAGLKWRVLTYGTAAGMTLVYTGLIGYAWAFHNLEDCGCFGKYLAMGPGMSIVKNAVLLGLMAWVYLALRNSDATPKNILVKAIGWTATCAVFITVAAASSLNAAENERGPVETATSADRPLSGIVVESDAARHDLGDGLYFVAMLSATCDHCRASVPMLNELTLLSAEVPTVALVLGEPHEGNEFRVVTDALFPLTAIEPLSFFSLIGSAPPRLIYAENGAVMHHWDWQDEPPGLNDVLSRVEPSVSVE